MIRRLKRQTKHNAKRPHRLRPGKYRIDLRRAAKQFARAIFTDLSLPAHRVPIIGAPFSPDVWKP